MVRTDIWRSCALFIDLNWERGKKSEVAYQGKTGVRVEGVTRIACGSWMMVERKSWHGQRDSREKDQVKSGNDGKGSRFMMLSAAGKMEGNNGEGGAVSWVKRPLRRKIGK